MPTIHSKSSLTVFPKATLVPFPRRTTCRTLVFFPFASWPVTMAVLHIFERLLKILSAVKQT